MKVDDILIKEPENSVVEESQEEQSIKADNAAVLRFMLSSMHRFISQRHNTLEPRWRDADKMAHGKSVGHYYKSQSKVTVPAIRNAIRAVASRLRDVLWGGRDNFDISSIKEVLGVEAITVKAYINYQLKNLGRYRKTFYNIFYDFIWDVCTYGKGWLKLSWQMVEGMKKQRVWEAYELKNKAGFVTGKKYRPAVKKVNETLYDGLMIERLSIFDVYIDASIAEITDQPIVEHRMLSGWKPIQDMADAGVYPFLTPDMEDSTKSDINSEQRDYSKMVMDLDKGVMQTPTQSEVDNYERLEAYFWWKNKDGDMEYRIATALVGDNGAFLIQNEEFPYFHNSPPILEGNFEKDNTVAYGYGIPDASRENQIELNDNRRQLMDVKTFGLNCMWLWDITAGTAPKYMSSQPNKVIPTMSLPGVKQVTPEPSIMDKALMADNLIMETIRETSSAPANMQGLPTRFGTTATESAQILTQAGVSIVDIAKQLEETVINRMLTMIYSLDRQFITQAQVVMVLGANGLEWPETLNPYTLKEDVNFNATGSMHMQNRMIVAQLLNNVLASADRYPGVAKVNNIFKKLFELAEIGNVENYINLEVTEESVDPQEENMMLAQGQEVVVNKKDQDFGHIAAHYVGRDAAPEFAKPSFDKHIADQERQYVAKNAQREQTQGIRSAGGGGEPGGPAKVGTNHQPNTELGQLRQTEKVGKPRSLAGGGNG